MILKGIGWVLGLALLTGLTQVGGILVLLWQPIRFALRKKMAKTRQNRWIRRGMFAGYWVLCSLVLIPLIAKPFGREALPIFGSPNLKPFHIGYCLLSRHYVRPELKEVLLDAADQMQKQFPGTKVAYLDSNFPFWNGFRLFPHLSHNDGRKADIAFFFTDEAGEYLPRRALTGIAYGGSVVPLKGEYNQPAACEDQGYWQYNLLYQLFPQRNIRQLDAARTKRLLQLLARDKRVGKVLLEPHLKSRLGLQNYGKIRFHGCRAVRHDDHLHVQL